MVEELASKILADTSLPGQDVIQREVSQLQSEWQDYLNDLDRAQGQLEETRSKWGDFNSRFDSLTSWIKDVECQVKGHDLKATLPEKEAQVEKFKVGRPK